MTIQQTEQYPQLRTLTNGELCSRYQFDDSPVIQEFVKRLSKIEEKLKDIEVQIYRLSEHP